MNRRDFLKAISALGLSATLPFNISEASEEVVNQHFQNGGYVYFEVNDRTIWIGDYVEPATRADLFERYDSIETIDELIDFQERYPVSYYFEEAFSNHIEQLKSQITTDNKEENKRIKALLAKYEEDLYLDWQVWLDEEPDLAFSAYQSAAEDFLSDAPDDDDAQFTNYTQGMQGQALSFFRDYEEIEVLEKLNINIVEGECPGSSYYAAELRIPIEEANEIAKEIGLDYQFKSA